MSFDSLYTFCFIRLTHFLSRPPITNASCEVLTDWCSIEMWITLISLYIGTIFYALLISNVSSIILSMNVAGRRFKERLSTVDDYMHAKKLPIALRFKVRDYLSLRFSEGKIFDEEAILSSLSPALQKEIRKQTSKEILLRVPVLRKASSAFINEFAAALEPLVYFASDKVVIEGTLSSEFYMIQKGSLRVSCETGKVAEIGPGCFFGEVSILFGMRRTCTVTCVETSMLYVAEKEAFLSACHSYPSVREYFTRVALKRLQRRNDFNESKANSNKSSKLLGSGNRDEADMEARYLNLRL